MSEHRPSHENVTSSFLQSLREGEPLLFMTKHFPQGPGQGRWSLKRFQRPYRIFNSTDKDLRELTQEHQAQLKQGSLVRKEGTMPARASVFDVFIDGHFCEQMLLSRCQLSKVCPSLL